MGVNEPIKLSFEFNLPNRYMRFVGSANGLVCFFDFKIDKLYISNPLLGEFFALPEFLSRSQSKAAYGFSCSTVQLAYKILRIKKDCPARDTTSKNSTAELYTFKTGKWMNIGHALYPQASNGRFGARVNGILHWIIEDPESSDVICCFDIEKEVFGSVQLPSALKNFWGRIDLKVESLRNTLFVFHGSSMYLHIFSMKEYGVNRSWSQDHKIQKSILPPPLRTSELQPITMWRDKFLFSAPQGPLLSYNSTTNVFAEVNTIGMHSGFQGFEYLSTFLSIKKSVEVETIALWKKVIQVLCV
ncbi:uncharacterized protein LOC132269878 [Cornus florida]|uniref:uncharacterized protein LOC132269878 n=1 Tax=Cornus florida TaxID=4283 RepID=UPI0028A06D81|nr:uncharacterized protein LOC132269878 [Cornus florida]